nr:GGDEF domain-containing protein [Marinomonas sp. IMCC 4694]
MQLTIFNANGKRIPITVNATVKENGCIYWSFFNSSKRDQLYDELIKAREKLTEALEKVNILASLDDLTGLLNRREMKHKSAHAIEKAASQGQTVTLLLLDIDHFKKINDSYGHLEGDRVLMALGTLLKKSIEQQNNMEKMGLVSRFGGEEFLILLTNITEADALSFCNRLHRSMADIVVGGAPLKASIGVSTLTPGMTFEALFTQADGAMYQAKERGRDRTEIFTSA